MFTTLRRWFQKPKTPYVRPENRFHVRPRVEQLEDRVNPSSLALLATDQPDYAPGSTATFTGTGFEIGENVNISIVADNGTSEAFSVTDGGAKDLDGVADGNFTAVWLCDPNGAYFGATLTATATGNLGSSASTTFTDAVSNKPGTPDLVDASDTFASDAFDSSGSNNDNLTKNTSLTFTVTGNSAGASITLKDGATTLGTQTVGAGNVATFSGISLAAGSHTLTATQTELGKTVSVSSSSLTINIDTTAPSAPTITSLQDDSGFSTSDNVTRDSTPTINLGSISSPGLTRLYDFGPAGVSVPVLVGSEGHSSGSTQNVGITTALSNGLHVIKATQLDNAGNESAFCAGFTIVVDTIAPIAPAAPTVDINSPSTGQVTVHGTVGSLTVAGANPYGAVTTDGSLSVPVASKIRLHVDGAEVANVITTDGTYSFVYTPTPGPHTYTVEHEDRAGNSVGLSAGVVQNVVADAVLTGSSAATAIGGIEGVNAATLGNATFTDTNTSAPSVDFTVTAVTWGDGGTDASGLMVSGSGGTYTVQGAHLYGEEGTFNFTITVTGDGGQTAAITGTATVADAALTGSSTALAGGTEGAANSSVLAGATFTDANPGDHSADFTATITWGELGPTSLGTVSYSGGIYTVAGVHTYAEEGSYSISISVVDDGGQTAAITGTATVADAALTGSSTALAGGTEGAANSSVLAGATFTDANPGDHSADFTATITWGELGPTSLGTVSYSGGIYTVAGVHTYAEEGTYSIGISVVDDGGQTATITGTATVADAALTGSSTALAGGTEGAANSSVLAGATFTDANPGDHSADFTATITWGDLGPTSLGTVSYSGGVYTVAGVHTYAEEGSYSISISVVDDGGQTATITGTATVDDPAVVAAGGFTFAGSIGVLSSNKTVATFTDPGGAEAVGAYSATINWGDNSSSTGTIAFSGGLGSSTDVFTVQGSHAYTTSGAFTITVTIHHETAPDQSVQSYAFVTHGSSITANFNGTAIQKDNYLWFSSVLKASGLSKTTPTTILFVDQTITVPGYFTLPVPNASITYHPGTGLSTTIFSEGVWYTDVYIGSGLSGNQFLSGFGFQLPSNLPGGIKNVTWSGLFFTNQSGVSLNWQWGAAVYTKLPTLGASIDYAAMKIKPVDDTKTSVYKNSDHAGTPEGTLPGSISIKSKVIGGATGGGGSNFTGSYSGTVSCRGEFVMDQFFDILEDDLSTL